MYFDPYTLQNYLNQLYKHIQYQNDRVNQLEQTLRLLSNELEELKNRPYTNIERVEYKFDQLKVETLEGVLNIGLNPSDPESIDQFDVQQKGLQVNEIHKELKKQISEQSHYQIIKYLDEECPKEILDMAKKQSFTIDETYQQLIIEDIKKQVNGRIMYYIQSLRLHEDVDVKEQVEFIEEKVKEDIQNSILQFIKHIPNEMKGDLSE